jgi:hypothetical protein
MASEGVSGRARASLGSHFTDEDTGSERGLQFVQDLTDNRQAHFAQIIPAVHSGETVVSFSPRKGDPSFLFYLKASNHTKDKGFRGPLMTSVGSVQRKKLKHREVM